MSTFIVIIVVLSLIAALERSNRRQSPHPPGPLGSQARDDRDWARIKLDLQALDDTRVWKSNHHSGPRPA